MPEKHPNITHSEGITLNGMFYTIICYLMNNETTPYFTSTSVSLKKTIRNNLSASAAYVEMVRHGTSVTLWLKIIQIYNTQLVHSGWEGFSVVWCSGCSVCQSYSQTAIHYEWTTAFCRAKAASAGGVLGIHLWWGLWQILYLHNVRWHHCHLPLLSEKVCHL